MKRWMKMIVMRVLEWALKGEDRTSNEIFNSIRINVLVSQLIASGDINKVDYEKEVADRIYDIIGRDSNDGFQRV